MFISISYVCVFVQYHQPKQSPSCCSFISEHSGVSFPATAFLDQTLVVHRIIAVALFQSIRECRFQRRRSSTRRLTWKRRRRPKRSASTAISSWVGGPMTYSR